MIHKKGLVFPSNCASFPKDGRLIYTTVKLTARVYAILMNCVFYYIIQRRANQIILWIRLVQVGVCEICFTIYSNLETSRTTRFPINKNYLNIENKLPFSTVCKLEFMYKEIQDRYIVYPLESRSCYCQSKGHH